MSSSTTLTAVITKIETETEKLSAEVDDRGILRVVLNNPSRHNSLTTDMMNSLRMVSRIASDRNDIAAVLLQGQGTDAFASGADIAEQQTHAKTGTENPNSGLLFQDLQNCTKPVVAMIHGHCVGGGLIVAMAADVRIASSEATFSIPPARLGVAYPSVAINALVDLVGRGWASDMLFTGDHIDASTARDIGLITRLHSKDDLEQATEKLLARLRANAPLSIMASKICITHACSPIRKSADDVQSKIDTVWMSKDAAEGLGAFFDKRTPQFRGR